MLTPASFESPSLNAPVRKLAPNTLWSELETRHHRTGDLRPQRDARNRIPFSIPARNSSSKKVSQSLCPITYRLNMGGLTGSVGTVRRVHCDRRSTMGNFVQNELAHSFVDQQSFRYNFRPLQQCAAACWKMKSENFFKISLNHL